MRFFEAQEQARGQTRRLMLLFVLTVVALVLAVNGALALVWRLITSGFIAYPAYFFSVNTGLTLLAVLGGWWLETSVLDGGGERLARRAGARARRRLLRRAQAERGRERHVPGAGAARRRRRAAAWRAQHRDRHGPRRRRAAELAPGTIAFVMVCLFGASGRLPVF